MIKLVLAGIVALLPLFAKLLNKYIKSPEQEREEFLLKANKFADSLSDAVEKAAGNEKDPKDLSKLINTSLK